ncbi:hypothetical protein QZH41_016642 [Actinostola sp. cb2023]|nr:hypothetical protein QZH41_016642 [Actinostola sp. cb2023]
MQTRVLDECTIPFVLDDAGRTTDEKKKLTDLLLDIFNGGGIANCQRMSKSTTSPIITMNDWVLADLNSDKAVISRAVIIPFLKVERNPVADQTLYEKALDDSMKDASRSVGEIVKFGKHLTNSQTYFDEDLMPFLQEILTDDRLLNVYSLSLFAAEKVLDAAGFANEKGALRQYFRNVVYQFGIKPFQLEDDEDDTAHIITLPFLMNLLQLSMVKTILISKSSWRDKKESVPAIALRLKECLVVLEKNGIPHPPENLLRKTIRQNCLGATNNTSQWFNKKGLVLLESQHMTSRKDKEQKVCIYIRRSVLQEDLLQKLDKACGEEPCSETTGENELPSVTTVIEELPNCNVTTGENELPSVTTGENELPSVTTVIEELPSVTSVIEELPSVTTGENELPSVTTGENELPSVTTVMEELPSVTTGENELPSVTTGENELPSVTTGENELPSVTTVMEELPSVTTGENELPSVTTGENELPCVTTVIEELPSVTTVIEELPSVTTVIEELPSVTTVIEELPSVTTVIEELPSVTTVIEELPSVTTGENELPSVTTVMEELPSVTTGENELPSVTTCD